MSVLPDAATYERYKVTVPVGEQEGMRVERFTVDDNDPENLRLVLHNREPIPSGRWTKLSDEREVWMSDVPAEILDHAPFFNALFWQRTVERVLINGLGLGMCVQQAIRSPRTRHIDVIESDARVIALVAPHYEAMAREHEKTLIVHHADAYTIKWPSHVGWDIAWHDIWPTISEENLDGMTKLLHRYGHRVDWQGCWCQKQCRNIRSGASQRAHARTMARFYRQMGMTPKIMRQMQAMIAGQ